MKLSLRARLWRSLLRRAFQNQPHSLDSLRAQSRISERIFRLPRRMNVHDVDIHGVHGLWIHPQHAAPHKVILYLHGGGYVTGNSRAHLALCVPMARTLGMDMLLPDYRLAPEHPFPAALEDAQSAYRWLLAQGYAPHHIMLAGDSAGGGLSVATALALRAAGLPLPGGIVCLSPWADLTLSGQSYTEKANADVILTPQALRQWAAWYTDPDHWNHPLVSPTFANLTGLPPMLIQTGSEEILRDDSLTLAAHAKAAGVHVTHSVYQGLWHVWHLLGDLIPESQAAFEEIKRWSQTHMTN